MSCLEGPHTQEAFGHLEVISSRELVIFWRSTCRLHTCLSWRGGRQHLEFISPSLTMELRVWALLDTPRATSYSYILVYGV